jgi:exodeoxyribonuclease VII large subunit
MAVSPQLSLISPTDEAMSVSQFNAASSDGPGPDPALWLRGEVVGLKPHPKGHWYFTLREGEAQVRCAMWRTYSQRAGEPPKDGTEVFVLARADYYEAKGEFQLSITRMLPTAGMGAAQRELSGSRRRCSATGSSIRPGSGGCRSSPAPLPWSPASPARRCTTS